MKKIAFLFLIYDKINNEELWNIFFNNIDINKYNIYIHYKYKYNTKLKYFDNYKLNNNLCIETKYADISIIKAQNVLLKEALKDQNNAHFIFLSGACIPFQRFDYIYNFLNSNKSYFNLSALDQIIPRAKNAL